MLARIFILIAISLILASACEKYTRDLPKKVAADPPPSCTVTGPIIPFAFCGTCVPLLENNTECGIVEYPQPIISAHNYKKDIADTVEICFVPPRNPLCARNLNVSSSQVNTYLAQGSTLGPCDPFCEIRLVTFGYNNPNLCSITLTAGSSSNFVIGTNLGSTAVGQPSVFNTGVTLDAFSLLISAGSNVVWEVITPEINETRCVTVNATTELAPCISPCLNTSCFTSCIACAQGTLLRNLLRVNACPGSGLFNLAIEALFTQCNVNVDCTKNCCVQDTCLLNGITNILNNALNLDVALCLTAAIQDLSTLSLNVSGDLGLLQASEALISANVTCNLNCTDLSGIACTTSPLGCGGSLNVECFTGCTACAVASVFVQVSLGSSNCPNVPLLSYLLGQAALAAETVLCGVLSGCGVDPLCCNYAECVRNTAITLGAINSDVANLVNCANGLLANPNLIINTTIGNLLTAANLTCLMECTAPGASCCLNQTCFDPCFCLAASDFLSINGSVLTSLCEPAVLCPGQFNPISLTTCLLNCPLNLLQGECLEACQLNCLNGTCLAVSACLTDLIVSVDPKFTSTCLDTCILPCGPILGDEKKYLGY